MDHLREEQNHLARWEQLPKPHKPLPGQLDLFGSEQTHQAWTSDELFDSGRDLPGADEREQRIIWDVEV